MLYVAIFFYLANARLILINMRFQNNIETSIENTFHNFLSEASSSHQNFNSSFSIINVQLLTYLIGCFFTELINDISKLILPLKFQLYAFIDHHLIFEIKIFRFIWTRTYRSLHTSK